MGNVIPGDATAQPPPKKDYVRMPQHEKGQRRRRRQHQQRAELVRGKRLPQCEPRTNCHLKVRRLLRMLDYLLLEEELLKRQAAALPSQAQVDQRQQFKEIKKIRGMPIAIGRIEELFDNDRAIVTITGSDMEFYLPILSFVEKQGLHPGMTCLVKMMLKRPIAVVGLVGDEAETTMDVFKMTMTTTPTETFADVGGLDDAIQELIEAVEIPLTHPQLYSEMGIRIPKGCILYGPPGTGKTLLAKAVANRTHAVFIRVSGSDLVQKHSGEGPKLVKNLFQLAEDNAPSIVFIDEVDAIGTKRNHASCSAEREVQRTLLELLNQLDGFESRQDVMVIMATNRIDTLDTALIRPGRIDRKIEVRLPDETAQRKIFAIQAGRMHLADDVTFDAIFRSGFAKQQMSGAEIRAVCTEAGMIALRRRSLVVTVADFAAGIDAVQSAVKQTAMSAMYL